MSDAFAEVDKLKVKRSLAFRIFKYGGVSLLALILLAVIFLLCINYHLNQEIAEMAPEIEKKYAERLATILEVDKQGNSVRDFFKAVELLGSDPSKLPSRNIDYNNWEKEANLLEIHKTALLQAKQALTNENGCSIEEYALDYKYAYHPASMSRLILLDNLRLHKDNHTEDAINQTLQVIKFAPRFSKHGGLLGLIFSNNISEQQWECLVYLTNQMKPSKNNIMELINKINNWELSRNDLVTVVDNESVLTKKLLIDLLQNNTDRVRKVSAAHRSYEPTPIFSKWIIVRALQKYDGFLNIRKKELSGAKLSQEDFEITVYPFLELLNYDILHASVGDPNVSGYYERHNWRISCYRTALYIETYRADKGKYPEKLEELVPDYIASIPIDPVSKQSFVYQLYQDSYRLYSIGRNGKDESDMQGGDDIRITRWSFPKKNK